MKKVFTIALMSIIAFAGCQQEMADSYESDSDIPKVYASIEESSETKTSLNEKDVFWSSGDRIAVFLKNTLRKRFDIMSESVGSKKGTFQYDSDYIVTGNNTQISNNIAYYPFSDVICTPNGDSYTIDNVTLPEIQKYVPESFDDESFPMVAVTRDAEDVDFAFKNVCGVLAFQLKGSGVVKSISIKGNSDEILSGKAVIKASLGENPEILLLSDGNNIITLDCGETGVELKNEKQTSFFISIPPVIFDNGFTITVTDINGEAAEYSTTKENSILRSTILWMPEKEYVGMDSYKRNDYIDELGINHGPGVEIDGVVWAPVNCGYHETDFKYGKLYQWGRKYGQGYSGSFYVNGNKTETYSDALVPATVPGPVAQSVGQSKDNENMFYYNSYPYDWCSPQNDNLWNSGTESRPVKTEYDPCPEGWRVPTYAEFDKLNNNYSSWTTNELGQEGYWFSGTSSYTAAVPQVFFPAAGSRGNYDGKANSRGLYGTYWSSRADSDRANPLNFISTAVGLGGSGGRAGGYSVRCVHE
jgi:uncharacterized protein (TIGR02145 family)